MAGHWDGGRRWGRWAECWYPALLLATVWTLLTVSRGAVEAAFVFFSFCAVVGVGVSHDMGAAVPWTAVPVAAFWLTSLTGPLVGAPVPVLLVVAAMAATTPLTRSLGARRRATADLALLSDWGLHARWSDTEASLQRADRPDQRLDIVRQRAEILDELVRRSHEPGRTSPRS